jgi:uncharacterized protein (TIGR02466 family)
MKNKILNLIFPTPIANIQFDDNLIFDNSSKYLISLMKSNDNLKFNNTGHYCTSDNLNLDINLIDLIKIIDNEIKIFAEDVYKINKNDIKMSCMWANIRSAESKHHVHLHQNSYISGVLYLNSSTISTPGDIFFVDPRIGNRFLLADHIDENNYMSSTWKFTPKKGMMLIFPGWLEHGTDCGNFSNLEYRISVSFNYTLIKSNQNYGKF